MFEVATHLLDAKNIFLPLVPIIHHQIVLTHSCREYFRCVLQIFDGIRLIDFHLLHCLVSVKTFRSVISGEYGGQWCPVFLGIQRIQRILDIQRISKASYSKYGCVTLKQSSLSLSKLGSGILLPITWFAKQNIPFNPCVFLICTITWRSKKPNTNPFLGDYQTAEREIISNPTV